MIKFNIRLSNPFVTDVYRVIYSSYGRIFKNKYYEVLLTRESRVLVGIYFNWTIRESHAGIGIGISLLGYDFMIEMADERHWNYETNTWETVCEVYKDKELA